MRGRDERGDRRDLERRAERREDPHSSVESRQRADDNAEFADLPDALVSQSLATSRLILPLGAALEAIDQFARAGRRLESWEGWVKMRDGGRTRSLAHSGSFALPAEAQRAASAARTGMQHAQARWDRDPEYPNATLYFGLTFARASSRAT